MPRVRALVLLGLFVANQVACTSWQVPKVTPQEYVAQHPDSTVTGATDGRPTYEQRGDPLRMRITLKDPQGKSPAKIELTGIRFSEDSIFGRESKGEPRGYSLGQVAKVEVRGAAPGLTGLAVVGVGLGAATAAFLYVGLNDMHCMFQDRNSCLPE